MALTYTGRLGRNATVTVSRPNDIRDTAERFDFSLQTHEAEVHGPARRLETEPTRDQLLELKAAIEVMLLEYGPVDTSPTIYILEDEK